MFAPSPFLALVRRELLVSMRQRKTWLLMTTTVFLIGFVFVLSVGISPQISQGSTVQMAESIFTRITMLLAGLVFLVVPLFAAPSVCVERQNGTFDILRATAISTRSILFGKLINATGLMLLLVVAVMPVVGVLLFYAGLDISTIVFAGAILLVETLVVGSIAIVISTRARSAMTAVGITFLCLFPMAFMAAVAPQTLLLFIPFISVPMLHLLFADSSIAMSDPAREPVDDDKIQNPQMLVRRRRRFPWYIVDPLAPVPTIPDETNPVLAKDIATTSYASTSAVYRKGAVIAIITLISMVISALGTNGLTLFVPLLLLLLIPLEIIPLMTREFEERTVEMLETTLLPRREILKGKRQVAQRSVAAIMNGILIGLCLPLMLMVVLVDFGSLLVIGLYVGALTCCVQTISAISLLTSVIFKRTIPALASTYLCIAVIVALPFFVRPLVSTLLLTRRPVTFLGGVGPSWDSARLIAGFFSPVHAPINAMSLPEITGAVYIVLHWGLFFLVSYRLYRIALYRFSNYRLEGLHHGA